MAVRHAAETDLPEIMALIRELAEYERAADEVAFAEDDLRRHLFGDTPAASVLLAVDGGGAVAGFALWFPTFSTWLGRPGIWLEDLFVRPERRGEGFGMALLAELRSMTDGRVEWAVLDWNEPSIRFYESLGARPVEGWTRYRWV
jgi:GNAT superfamily N-acetyltransferase